MMVVGRTRTLQGARTVRLTTTTVRIGSRHCVVPRGTALAGLLAAGLSVHVTDAAGCDPAAMFVTRVGPDTNSGIAGWEYKIGHVAPSVGAGDPAGRLRRGQQLLWFWCVRATSCQRTLSVTTQFSGSSVTFRVIGYDDNGHGVPIKNATVHAGRAKLTTGADGSVTVTLAPGRYKVYATKAGLVRSFPSTVAAVP
jgi:hypothetical protein